MTRTWQEDVELGKTITHAELVAFARFLIAADPWCEDSSEMEQGRLHFVLANWLNERQTDATDEQCDSSTKTGARCKRKGTTWIGWRVSQSDLTDSHWKVCAKHQYSRFPINKDAPNREEEFMNADTPFLSKIRP